MEHAELRQAVERGEFKEALLYKSIYGAFLICALPDGTTHRIKLSASEAIGWQMLLEEKGLLRHYSRSGTQTLLVYAPRPW